MREFILPLLYLLGIATTTSFLTKRSFSIAMPFGFLASGLILYGFGLFDQLQIGYIFLYLYSALSLFFIITRKNRFEYLKSPVLVAFAVFYAFIYVFNLNRGFSAWDEFSHWGPMVQEIFRLDKFYSVGESILAYHKDYPPFIPLLESLWLKLTGTYSESHLYIAMQMMAFMFVMPALHALDDRFSLKSIAKVFGLFFVFFVAFNTVYMEDATFYRTIYTDGLLAVLVAYGVFIAIQDECDFKLIELAVITSALLLSKQIGLFFFGLLLMVYGLNYLIVHFESFKSYVLNITKKDTLLFLSKRVGFLVFIPWLFRASWERYLLSFTPERQFNTSVINLSQLSDIYFRVGGEGYQSDALHNFLRTLFSGDTLIFNIPMTYWQLMIISVFVLWLLNRLYYTNFSKRKFYVLSISLTIGALLYAFVMMLLYVFNFGFYEGPRLASYSRYMNTYWFMIITLFTMLVIDLNVKTNKNGIMILVVIFSLLMLNGTKVNHWQPVFEYASSVDMYRDEAEYLVQSTEEDARIFMVCQTCNAYDNNAMRYLVNPRWINAYVYSIGVPTSNDDIFTYPITPNDYKALIETYDYLYLYNINDYYLGFIEDVFSLEDELEVGGLYAIQKYENRLELEKMIQGSK